MTSEVASEAESSTKADPSSDFLLSSGRMGELIRAKDWSTTPLGPISAWPGTLRTAVAFAVHSKQPVCVAWGAEMTALFNDAYLALTNQVDSIDLGRPLPKLWPTIWPLVNDDFAAALAGESTVCTGVVSGLWLKDKPDDATITIFNTPIKERDGKVSGVLATLQESSAKGIPWPLVPAANSPQHNVFADIVHHASIGILQVAIDGRILLANQNIHVMLGWPVTKLTGRSLSEIVFEDDRWPTRRSFAQLLEKGKSMLVENRYLRPDDTHIWASNRMSLVRDGNGKPLYAILVISDITQRKDDEEHTRYLATHDALTSLPNRTLLHDRLKHAIEKAQRSQTQVGVLFLDLNRFKNVNDSLGHDVGDELLHRVAARLKKAVREGDTVARLGGDEFVVVLEEIGEIGNVAAVATSILQLISEPLHLAGHEISVSTSIGACVFPRDGHDNVTLLKHADVAMYQAKEFGEGTFRFYNPQMNVAVLDRLLSEASLQRALERQEFLLHYQPRFSLETGEIEGVEALLRWRHPEKGMISPADFIPLAEEIGLIGKIGEWVLFEACRQACEWQSKGLPAFAVSVNISFKQMPELSSLIRRVLAETGLAPAWLELEITESGLMENLAEVQKILLDIRRLGVSLAIDDFGTGYSSLSYLRMLPINCLKIDRSFIMEVISEQDDATIVSATIALAHDMNLKVVAEGVTNKEQLRFLAKRRCDQVQGYLPCSPLAPDHLESFIKGKRHTIRELIYL